VKADIATALTGTDRYRLTNGRLPASVVDPTLGLEADDAGFIRADVLVAGGRIAAITAAIGADAPTFDLEGGQLWPAGIELHTHLDKAHTVTRAHNPDGTILAAVEAVRKDRLANWSPEDIERRFDFSLRCAYAHGTSAIRTHIDSYAPQAPISWPVFATLRDRWAARMDLQGVALTMLNVYETEEGEELANLVAAAGGLLGGVTRLALPPEQQTAERIAHCLDQLLRLASERQLDVDLHVDETAEVLPNTLKLVAEAVLRNRFRGRVVCGHCCSLSRQSAQEIRQTIALVREAGLSIVTLPMVNLHLQGRRPAQTPRWRGVTLVRELAAAGVPLAASSDNSRDPMHPFGDFDPVEVFRETVRICHLDQDCTHWVPLITKSPADIMRLPAKGRLMAGVDADLIVFRARSMSELFARPHAGRTVLRRGRPIDSTLPDYRELDPQDTV